jgi:hypothetical protein
MSSFLEIHADSEFPLRNIPFGVAAGFGRAEGTICTRVGGPMTASDIKRPAHGRAPRFGAAGHRFSNGRWAITSCR